MTICSSQGRHLLFAKWTSVAKLSRAPAEGFTTKFLDEQVRHQTSMATVSIDEWMYCHQSVMQSDGHFVPIVGLVLYPVVNVVEQCPCFRLDPMWFDIANAAFPLAIHPCPTPDIAKHLLVKLFGVFLVQQVSRLGGTATTCPGCPIQYVVRLGNVEFSSGSDPGLQKRIAVRRGDRCCVGRFLKRSVTVHSRCRDHATCHGYRRRCAFRDRLHRFPVPQASSCEPHALDHA